MMEVFITCMDGKSIPIPMNGDVYIKKIFVKVSQQSNKASDSFLLALKEAKNACDSSFWVEAQFAFDMKVVIKMKIRENKITCIFM